MAKDQTEIGITGLPIPKKKRSPKKQYEFEKKRRENLGSNVGGRTYSSDVSPNYNPRQRTFEEFVYEAKKAKHQLSKKKIEKILDAQGGIGAKAVEKYNQENPDRGPREYKLK
jgi:hypothetical protein